MPLFLLGLFLGGLSGCGTYLYTGDSTLGAAVGVIVMVLAWLCIGTVVILDD
ncbi:hypothetical protein ACWDZ4_20480 [Streptomyces sp. NPDC003016]